MKTAEQIKEKISKTREKERLKNVERYLKILEDASEEMHEKEKYNIQIEFDTYVDNVRREPEIQKWLQDAGLELCTLVGSGGFGAFLEIPL